MKSLVLCETSFVEQTERIMEEEKTNNDSGGATTAGKLKEADSICDWSENPVIPSSTVKTCQADENNSCSKEAKKELTNGNANDVDDNRTSKESPDKCVSNGVNLDIVVSDRTKITEESDAEVNVNSVNNLTKSEAETESEVKEADKEKLSDVKKEEPRDVDVSEKETESSVVLDEALKSEIDVSDQSVIDLGSEEGTESAVEESDAGGDRVSDSKTNENKKEAEEKSDDRPISNGILEKGKEDDSSDQPVEVFDEEGNKENEKMDSDKQADVFTIEDDEETGMEVERTSDESKYNIHVSDCQSVSVQDEEVSWGELQNAESSKDYEADASDESKDQGEFCPEVTENVTDDVETEEAKGETTENLEDEVKIDEEDGKVEEDDGENHPEEETSLPAEENFAVEETILEIEGETLQQDEEAAVETAVYDKVRDSRKRSVEERQVEPETERKRRKTDEEEGVSYVDSEDEDVDDPLPQSSPPTFSDDSDAQGEKFENQKKRNLIIEGTETDSKKLKLADDISQNSSDIKTDEEKRPAKAKTALEESIDNVATNKITLPFMDSLRGTLKNLTRSDLEELTVQKLCEVITERSSVGELRRRAQALEQDQEKWKEKVQSLTKQIREMEMVMKKYMSEVQKQNKEKNFQIITPIRVTRSVGLQVSFLQNANKNPRIPQGQSPTAAAPLQNRGIKTALPKSPIQANAVNVISPNLQMRNKPLTPTTAAPRTILSPQKNIVQIKKNFPPRPGVVNALVQNRAIAPQPLMNSNRIQQQNQITTIRPAFKVTAAPQQTGSKVIDLTDDDDKQMNQKTLQTNPGARNPPGTVRVVNSLQQPQLNQGNRVAYLVPTTTSTAGAGTGNRQFVIATSSIPTQNRQIVSSMPPLIFKGGNFVPAGAQATIVNQNVRPLAPKQFRHPAPLPQPPPNQIHRANWKLLPPRPALKISRVQTGIVLSWNMNLGPEYESIASYQLYAYQESNSPPTTSLWKKVGDVKALPLPMACTLTQFMTGHKYHFAVRAVDCHSRIGPFSVPNFIVL